MPEIAVIIVNYNAGAARLGRCLEALAKQSFRDFETILVDNASADGSLAAVDAPAGRGVRLLRQADNLGFAAANNLAARATHAPLLALLNPDAYPEPDWLAELAAAARAYPEAVAFGSTQLDANDPARLDGAGDAYHISGLAYRGHFGWPRAQTPGSGEVFAPCAAAALYRREAFIAVGGFEERFFCYHEDVDLGFRLRLAGGRCLQVASARVAHEGSALSGRRSDFAVYHGTRNRIWTFLRDMPAPALWAFLPLHIAANLAALGRSTMTGGFSATWRGVRDACLGAGPFLRERRALHGGACASASHLVGVMTWSPIKVLRRQADIRAPLDQSAPRRP